MVDGWCSNSCRLEKSACRLQCGYAADQVKNRDAEKESWKESHLPILLAGGCLFVCNVSDRHYTVSIQLSTAAAEFALADIIEMKAFSPVADAGEVVCKMPCLLVLVASSV